MKAIYLKDGTEFWVVIKPQPHNICIIIPASRNIENNNADWYGKPPYAIGEELYVKEAFCIECYKPLHLEYCCYKTCEDGHISLSIDCPKVKWRSPALMPAWAARKFVVVTDVKAEQKDGVWNWHYKVELVK